MVDFVNEAGRVITVNDKFAYRYRNDPGWTEQTNVPEGSVADVLEWAGSDLTRQAAAVAAEKAGKKRKGILNAW